MDSGLCPVLPMLNSFYRNVARALMHRRLSYGRQMMTIEKKTIRSDIPGSHVFLNGNIGYVGSPTDEMSRLIIARDITLNGDISACSYLVIEGIVQADSFSARRMDILDSGLFRGNAAVQDCVIAGRFEGKLSVLGRLTVKPTGQICGEVEYGVLEVEAGAKIEGQMTSIALPVAEIAAPVQTLPPESNVAPLFSPEEETEAAAPAGRAGTYRRGTKA
jgi:cytoskeletal protein CcmA (bactofilin family)